MTVRFDRRNLAHGVLAILVSGLLVQFFLRIHGTLSMPIYYDESLHIARANAVYRLDTNPLTMGHGKLLVYYWLGLFDPALTPAGLFAARAATALLTLLTGAALAAIARDLFGMRAMSPALVFYALIPHALFFERLALADPVATALGTGAVLACVRLAKQPTRARGIAAGLLIMLALVAKLTLVGLFALPLAAVLVLGDMQPPPAIALPWQARIARYRAQVWARYRHALTAAYGTSALLAGIAALVLAAGWLSGHTLNIMDVSPGKAHSVIQRRAQLAEIVRLLFSPALAGALVAVAALALVRPSRYRRGMLFVLLWWGALWIPIIALSGTQRARYLLVGVPALACIAGAAGAMLDDLLRTPARRGRIPRAVLAAAAIALVSLWMLAYALPFAHTTLTAPDRLALPALDKHNYVSGAANGWGSREALAYLERAGARTPDGAIPVFGVLWVCDLAAVYLPPDVHWYCESYRAPEPVDVADTVYDWQRIAQHIPDPHPAFVYVISDERPAAWPGHASARWRLEQCFTQPRKDRTVCVWHVAAAAKHTTRSD